MDFKTAANTILGYELSGSLVNVNVDSLQGILFALIRKVQEFSAKIERLEYELENRPTKADIFALREKLRTTPSQDSVDELAKLVTTKADKAEVDAVLENVHEVKESVLQLDSSLKNKASKQEVQMLQGQVAYLQENVGNQEQEIYNIRKAKEQLNGLSPSGSRLSVREAVQGKQDPRLEDTVQQLLGLQARVEELEKAQALTQVLTMEAAEDGSASRLASPKVPPLQHSGSKEALQNQRQQRVQAILEGKRERDQLASVDQSFVESKVRELLVDHPVLNQINFTIENTHEMFQAQKKEVERLRALVEEGGGKADTESSKQIAQTLKTVSSRGEGDKNFQWKREDFQTLQNAIAKMAANIDTKASKKTLMEVEKRVTASEDSFDALRKDLIGRSKAESAPDSLSGEARQKPKAWDAEGLGAKEKGSAGFQAELERLEKQLNNTRQDVAALAHALDKQQGAESKPEPEPPSDQQRVEQEEEGRRAPLLFSSSQIALLASRQEELVESFELQSAEVRQLAETSKKISGMLESKEESGAALELQELKDHLKEEILAIKAQLEQKVDRLEPQEKQERRKTNVEFEDLSDETILKEVLQDMAANIDLLFESKADVAAVQKALAEKGDTKVLATKANRSYCEALVERVSKALNLLSQRVDHFINNNGSDSTDKLSKLKRVIHAKADRAELLQISHTLEQLVLNHASANDDQDAHLARKQLYCLSCDRPVAKYREAAATPPLPLLPASLGSVNARGAFEVEYYRNQRKKANTPLNPMSAGLRLGSVVRKRGGKPEEAEEDLKLPSLNTKDSAE